MRIVSDTSILIDFLRTKLPEESIYYKLIQENYLIISIITVAELFSGKSAQTKKGKEKLNDLFKGIEIRIPYMEDAVRAGEIRYKHQLSMADAMVAALALKLNLPLVTLDQKSFERFKSLDIFPLHGL